jgi:hypothetical protein
MNEELKRIDDLIDEHCKSVNRWDENLFNLGVELGRLLEKENINSHRPQTFIDLENKSNEYDKKQKQFNRIKEVLFYLITNAMKEQIDTNGEFRFDIDYLGMHDKIEENISKKYRVQVIKTNKISNDFGSHEVEIKFIDDVADILAKEKISNYCKVDLDNTIDDSYEILFKVDDVRHLYDIHLNIFMGNYNEQQLITIADELERIQVEIMFTGKQII